MVANYKYQDKLNETAKLVCSAIFTNICQHICIEIVCTTAEGHLQLVPRNNLQLLAPTQLI